MQYAESHNESKTKPRTIPLIFSIPYVKDWIDSHPGAMNQMHFFSYLWLTITLVNNLVKMLYTNSILRIYKKCYFLNWLRSHPIPEVEKVIHKEYA